MSSRPTPVRPRGEPASLRRLSRQFSTVGVDIPAARLREIAGGADATDSERLDVGFALLATATLAEDRHARRHRTRRRYLHWVVIAGALLVALNVLAGLGFVLFQLIGQAHA